MHNISFLKQKMNIYCEISLANWEGRRGGRPTPSEPAAPVGGCDAKLQGNWMENYKGRENKSRNLLVSINKRETKYETNLLFSSPFFK